jgi:hypothetical protein
VMGDITVTLLLDVVFYLETTIVRILG